MLFALSWQMSAQVSETASFARHELKMDLTYLLVLPAFKVEYEYLLNTESSIGVSAMVNPLRDNPLHKYQFLGFYRLYFGEKPGSGFFLEGNMGITAIDRWRLVNHHPVWENKAKFGLGIAVGKKFVTQSGVVVDLFVGVGRILETESKDIYNDRKLYPRVGITVGKRF
jgi:hypothetical protein